MYCEFQTAFQCQGTAVECREKLQAMIDDLENFMADKHGHISCHAFGERLTEDDIHEIPDSEADLDGTSGG